MVTSSETLAEYQVGVNPMREEEHPTPEAVPSFHFLCHSSGCSDAEGVPVKKHSRCWTVAVGLQSPASCHHSSSPVVSPSNGSGICTDR